MTRRYDLELFLKDADVFRSLSARERKRFAAYSRERNFRSGEPLFHEGQPSDSVWLVLSGRVHLVHHLSGGKIQTSCVMTPGETFCCLPALDRGPYPATAVAATPSRVLQIPTRLFHETIKKNEALSSESLCVFCSRLRDVERRACALSDPAEQKVAKALLTLSRKFGETVPLTKLEIAELVGTTVETAIRTISRFQQEGWVRSGRRKTEILDAAALERLTS